MDEPQPKRIRLACLNCRYDPATTGLSLWTYGVAAMVLILTLIHSRKKTRCSGERPACAFCLRLLQDCQYDDGQLFLSGETNLYPEQAPLPPILPDHTDIAVRLILSSIHQSSYPKLTKVQ
jgi:hypothetical protein